MSWKIRTYGHYIHASLKKKSPSSCTTVAGLFSLRASPWTLSRSQDRHHLLQKQLMQQLVLVEEGGVSAQLPGRDRPTGPTTGCAATPDPHHGRRVSSLRARFSPFCWKEPPQAETHSAGSELQACLRSRCNTRNTTLGFWSHFNCNGHNILAAQILRNGQVGWLGLLIGWVEREAQSCPIYFSGIALVSFV